MENSRKKEILREYKERTVQPGVFAIKCEAAGKAWVSSAADLSRQPNGTLFQLKLGSHPNKDLQAVWNKHGEAAIAYEVLEDVSDENPLIIGELLKERDAQWRERLGAEKLTG